jgi:hypothetical protein
MTMKLPLPPSKKYINFLTDCVSVSEVLGKECETKPKACNPKRKRGEEDEVAYCIITKL